MTRSNDPETIRTTERSLDIVRSIQQRGGARVSDVATEFDLAKSTAYKHLRTLERRGYLVKEGDRYHIGLKFTNRGEYARARKPGYRIGADMVDELARRSDEEVDFFVENDGRGMTIYVSYDRSHPYVEESVDSFNKHWRVGTYYYLHCTAGGKAILSELPDERVTEVVDRWGLPARTEHTISDREELFAELEAIRDRGFATSREEYQEGLTAVAKPVMMPTGDPLGALAISMASYRSHADSVQEDRKRLLADVVSSFETKLEEVEYPDPFTGGMMS